MINAIREFLKLETAGGFLLLGATVLALVIANSPLSDLYSALLQTDFEIRLGDFGLAKPLLLWINDGLMAVFFFLVGLELKRELLEGELSTVRNTVLPVFGAIGGMVVPAAIYVLINRGDPEALKGWAIPAATDIAFALGILAMLGSRVPTSLKVFLVSLAIIDDIGAILIIAVFYTAELSLGSLLVAGFMVLALLALNRRGVLRKAPYLLLGVILWIAVLKSGVHATIAGVILAFLIPLRTGGDTSLSPLRELEHDLHTSVAFVILPLFAFANAGVSLDNFSLAKLTEPVPLGIMLGLFAGKQLGVFGFSALAIKLGLCSLPEKVNWRALYGVAVLCGIGFTMSLFIGSLAFEQGGPDYAVDDRIGILAGTFLSVVAGYAILKLSLAKKPQDEKPS